MKCSGRVFLIGAGPGDPGLISCKGMDILKTCDIVVYDALVNTQIIDGLPSRITRIYAGKRGGKPSMAQAAINNILAQEAKKGKCVARLKGGDPLVFGRGSEEMEFLHNRGIPFEVVPGISSALAVPAYAGIPVTHRSMSRSVAIVTGHCKNGDDITSLEIPRADTLVFLMGIENLGALVKAILSQGRFTRKTPAALIQDGTLPVQKTATGTLETIVRVKNSIGIKPPAVFVVGDVVRFTRTLSWFSRPPLAGVRVVVLRTSEQSDAVCGLLAEKGATVVRYPLIRIQPRKRSLRLLNKSYLEPFSMIIFTSPNAVSLVLQTLFDKGHDASILAGKKIYALGSGTADALLKFGIVPDGVPSRFVAEGLLSLLPRSLRNEHILIPRASIAREILPDSLRRRGAHVTVLPVYDTKKIATRDCPVQNGDYVLFTSSSVVDSFYSDKKRAALRIWPCCIGEVTAATLRRYFRGRIHIAKNAAMEALVDTLIKAAGFSHRKKNGKGR